MKKANFIFLCIISGALFAQASQPAVASAQEGEAPVKNMGVVPANIWYSKDAFFAGETVRIYTVIFNGSTNDLSGTVEFLDNGTPIGKTDFSVPSGGRVRNPWIDWKAIEGKHTISARVIESYASVAGGTKRSIVLENAETGKSERVVDLDTDSDGTGNSDDSDDDGDSVSDVEELRNGTDPLKKDTNGDGVSDGKELELATKKALEEEKKIASSTESQGAIADTIQKVESYIPAPVKAGATASANAIERFRVSEGYQLRLAKEEKSREIDAMKVRTQKTKTQTEPAKNNTSVMDTISTTAEKPLAYAMLASLAMLQYAFDWRIIFYGAIVFLLFVFLRWGIRRIRNQ